MHEGIKDLLYFLGIVAFFGFLWFFHGGKDRALQERTNVQVTDESGNVVRNVNQNTSGQTSGGKASGTGGGASVGTSTPTEWTNPNLTDTRYTTVENKSPYFKLITLSSPSGAASTDASREYITLTTQDKGQKRINISGWTLTSVQTGHQASIGTGVLLPSSYAATAVKGEDPITVAPKDRIIVSTGRSPIGNSFLVNKCTGYFNQFRTFNPYLNNYCPALRNEKLPARPNNLNDACLDYINSWSTCKTQVDALPERLSHECQVFISEETNYNKCVQHHQADKDFYSNEWRVYLIRNEPLWKTQREHIQLLDADGKLVDEVKY